MWIAFQLLLVCTIFIIVPMIVFGSAAAFLVLGAAEIGRFFGHPLLGGTLASIIAGIIIVIIGDIPNWAKISIGLSWSFTDGFLSLFGISGRALLLTMAIAYFLMGFAKNDSDILFSTIFVLPLMIFWIIISAVINPQDMINVDEPVISTGAIIAARVMRDIVARVMRDVKTHIIRDALN